MPEIILASLSILLLLLFFFEYNQRQHSEEKKAEKLASDTNHASNILDIANQKAANITNLAEENALRNITSLTQEQTKDLEQTLKTEFENAVKQLEQDYRSQINSVMKNLNQTEQDYKRYIDSLKVNINQKEAQVPEFVKTQVGQVLEKFEENLSDFLIETEQKTVASIELELRSSRQLIDNYKIEQLRLIDENIIATLERTLSLVLAKKLSLKDQNELVYESLEKAKVEKFIS